MASDLAAVLTAHGVRPTRQRLAVYAYLLEHRTHPNADSIYQALAAEYSRFSRTTVYNSLHALAEAGLIRELSLESEEQRFDGGMEDHGHFCCTACKAILDFPLKPSVVKSLQPKGCRTDRMEVILYGLCAACAAKSCPHKK